MKVKCARGPLHEAFQLAATVVPQRTTIPAVTNVKLTAVAGKNNSRLELSCTDLEFGLKIDVKGAEVKEEGTVVLPASRMTGILREAGDDVVIDSDGTLAHVKTSGASFKIVGIDPNDFPAIPGFEEKGALQVDTRDLGEMIRKTQFAVSSEVVRYALTGQLIEIHGKELRMVASDGKRLAFIKSKAGGKGAADVKNLRVIVPTKTLNLLDRVLTEEDESVLLHIEETQVRLKTSRAMIFSRLIDGNFPDYEAVIPGDRDKKIPLEREALFGAVRRAALMTTDKTRAVRFTFGKNKLVLFTRTQDVGEATVEIPIDYKGDEIDITFNPDYISDYLKVVTEEKVELHVKDRTSAGVFKSGKDYVYVIMPLTVNL